MLLLSACQTPVETPAQTPIADGLNVYEGEGFSFQYSDDYIAEGKEFWRADATEARQGNGYSLAPVLIADTRKLGGKTLEEIAIEDFSLGDSVWTFETVTYNEIEFLYVFIPEMFQVHAYYVQNGPDVLSFTNYFHNEDVLKMLKTLELN